jgi:hypothetical protein
MIDSEARARTATRPGGVATQTPQVRQTPRDYAMALSTSRRAPTCRCIPKRHLIGSPQS